MVGVFLSLCIIYYKCLWHFMVNFFRGEKTLHWPNDELMMFDWGLLLFFSNHFFLAKSQGWQKFCNCESAYLWGCPCICVTRERERKRDTEDFRGERVRERLRGCELVSKWYDIFFLSIVKCKHIRWGSDISYNTSNACPCSHNVSVETNLSSQARDRESLSFFVFSSVCTNT